MTDDPRPLAGPGVVILLAARYLKALVAPTDKNLHRAAQRATKALVDGKVVATTASPAEIEKRVFEALRANFQEEAAIEREAERILDENKRQTVGMDQRTLLLKIKERLARERGFVL
jgi:hypothetical protein